jgi:excisionase family DNA binding protein
MPEHPSPRESLETVPESLERLRISRGFLYKLIANGEIRSIVIGKRGRRIISSSVDEYIARRLDAGQAW